MKCGAYDASKYPNKTEFKGSAEREVSDSGVKEFFDELGETDSSQRQWVFKLVDRATGKYKKSFPRRSPNSKNEIAIEHQIIQPEIIITFSVPASLARTPIISSASASSISRYL